MSAEFGKSSPPEYETGAFDIYREELRHDDATMPAQGIAMEYARICRISQAALVSLNLAMRGYNPTTDGKEFEYQMRLAYFLEDEAARLASSPDLAEIVEAQDGEYIFLEMIYDLRHGATADHIAEAAYTRKQYMRSLRLANAGNMTLGEYIAAQGCQTGGTEPETGAPDFDRLAELRTIYHGREVLD